jgi:sirohydrochlorin cobaltochelatase
MARVMPNEDADLSPRPPPAGTVGLLVVGHGSRRREANETVRAAAAALARDGGWLAVEPAFLEIAEPDIAAGYGRLAAAGCDTIVVHPFFLFAGSHTAVDIPAALRTAQARHPATAWTLTEPLGLHPGVLAAVRARIADALAR